MEGIQETRQALLNLAERYAATGERRLYRGANNTLVKSLQTDLLNSWYGAKHSVTKTRATNNIVLSPLKPLNKLRRIVAGQAEEGNYAVDVSTGAVVDGTAYRAEHWNTFIRHMGSELGQDVTGLLFQKTDVQSALNWANRVTPDVVARAPKAAPVNLRDASTDIDRLADFMKGFKISDAKTHVVGQVSAVKKREKKKVSAKAPPVRPVDSYEAAAATLSQFADEKRIDEMAVYLENTPPPVKSKRLGSLAAYFNVTKLTQNALKSSVTSVGQAYANKTDTYIVFGKHFTAKNTAAGKYGVFYLSAILRQPELINQYESKRLAALQQGGIAGAGRTIHGMGGSERGSQEGPSSVLSPGAAQARQQIYVPPVVQQPTGLQARQQVYIPQAQQPATGLPSSSDGGDLLTGLGQRAAVTGRASQTSSARGNQVTSTRSGQLSPTRGSQVRSAQTFAAGQQPSSDRYSLPVGTGATSPTISFQTRGNGTQSSESSNLGLQPASSNDSGLDVL